MKRKTMALGVVSLAQWAPKMASQGGLAIVVECFSVFLAPFVVDYNVAAEGVVEIEGNACLLVGYG